jgi:Arc/MetJ family transcription regulator
MPRMMVQIDDRLLAEAKKLSGAHTKRETIEVALRELVRRRKLSELVEMAGRVNLKLTHKDLRAMRESR